MEKIEKSKKIEKFLSLYSNTFSEKKLTVPIPYLFDMNYHIHDISAVIIHTSLNNPIEFKLNLSYNNSRDSASLKNYFKKSLFFKGGDDPTVDIIVLQTVFALNELVKPFFNFYDPLFFDTLSSNLPLFSGFSSSPLHSFLTPYEIIPISKGKNMYAVHQYIDNTCNFEKEKSVEKALKKNHSRDYFSGNLIRSLGC
jgi:hypothetical protein